jgi:hypothetical protein
MPDPTVSAPRFTLRDLPLPAKLVITCFLLAVALGYTAALAQLHFQDSKSGQPMPTMADVVLKFTGKKWFVENPPRPVSKLEKLIMGPTDEHAVFGASGSMGPAFFSKDPSVGPKNYRAQLRASPNKKAELDAQREGERAVVRAWINAPDDARREPYDADRFVPPPDQTPKAIDPEWRNGDGYRVRSIIETRCVACHGKGGPQEHISLETYEKLAEHMNAPALVQVPLGGGWVKIQEPMSLTRLTQSTHAHLLSFAVLFSLTGFVFAFTSYPTSVRCIVGTWALVAIITDVVFWWLARMSDAYGVYFAKGVVGTGGAAGLGLGAQIVLSLWNMYGPRGKLVLVLLLALGVGLGSLVIFTVVAPGLEEKQRQMQETQQGKTSDNTKPPPVTPATKVSRLEQVLQFPVKDATGKELGILDMKFKEPDNNMVHAFFNQDKEEFAPAVKKNDQALIAELMPQRHGERLGLLAWGKLPDAERKNTYDANEFGLPPDLAKQTSPHYVKNGKLKIQSLIADRCVGCHGGSVKPENRFENYDSFKKFLDAPK